MQIDILPPKQGTADVRTSQTDFVSPLSLNKDGHKQRAEQSPNVHSLHCLKV